MFRILLLAFLMSLSGCSVADSSGINESDADVVEQLRQAGSNLSKPHAIEFFIVAFPDRASAERFGKQLDPTWKVEVEQTTNSTDWAVLVTIVMVPEVRAISALSAKFDRLAPEFGGDYDGWGALVVK